MKMMRGCGWRHLLPFSCVASLFNVSHLVLPFFFSSFGWETERHDVTPFVSSSPFHLPFLTSCLIEKGSTGTFSLLLLSFKKRGIRWWWRRLAGKKKCIVVVESSLSLFLFTRRIVWCVSPLLYVFPSLYFSVLIVRCLCMLCEWKTQRCSHPCAFQRILEARDKGFLRREPKEKDTRTHVHPKLSHSQCINRHASCKRLKELHCMHAVNERKTTGREQKKQRGMRWEGGGMSEEEKRNFFPSLTLSLPVMWGRNKLKLLLPVVPVVKVLQWSTSRKKKTDCEVEPE